MKPGIELLDERPGDGAPLRRHASYRVRLRMWLNRGEAVRWSHAPGPVDTARLEDDGATLVTDLRLHRGTAFAGLFQGMQGMCVGGTRKLRIAPHLAYGEKGIPGVIPPNALLTVEVSVLSERSVAG